MKDETVCLEVLFAFTAAISNRLAAVSTYIEFIFGVSWIGGDFLVTVAAEQPVCLHMPYLHLVDAEIIIYNM